MKVKYFLLLNLVLMTLLTGCNQTTSIESKQIQTKEGYIVDIVENKENYSILFYESSHDEISTITYIASDEMENINKVIQGFRRSKNKVVVNVSDDG